MNTEITSVKRTFIDGRYGQIHCRVAAERSQGAETIACLHMSPKSGRSFRQLLPWLADGRTVLAPDYPGYGESDPPPAEPHVRVEDYAEAVWQVVDQLGTGPVHLLGYHTGSMVAVEAATQRKDDVRSVINISAPIFTADETAALHEAYAPLPLDEAGTRFQIMWERILYHRGPGMTLEMAAESMADNLRGGEQYEWGHRAAFNYAERYRQRLAALELPVLIVNPQDDCWEQSQRADALLRNGRRIDFPQWGHGFLNAYPEQAARVVLDFIEGL